jgi:hypothetical protein
MRRFLFAAQARFSSSSATTAIGSRPRNPILTSVIREGLSLLQETSTKIQTSPITRQSFQPEGDSPDATDDQKSPRRQYMQHHIRAALIVCLEELLARNDSYSSSSPINDWSVRGEPVELVGIRISRSQQHAVVYWTVPQSYLDGNVQVDAVLQLQQMLHQHWSTVGANDRLIQAVANKLRNTNKWARVPVLRLEPATPAMLAAIQAEESE